MRRFLAVFAALALVALMAMPVMAAKPNLTFTTHLTWQQVRTTNPWVRLPGDMNAGFTGSASVKYQQLHTKGPLHDCIFYDYLVKFTGIRVSP